MVNLRDGHLNLTQNGHYNICAHNRDYVMVAMLLVKNKFGAFVSTIISVKIYTENG